MYKTTLMMVSLIALIGCGQKEKNSQSSDDTGNSKQFFIYNPQAEIKNFEFINDHNGVVVEWDFNKKEKEESQSATTNASWVTVNSDYLVRKRAKVRDSGATKKMKSDEYFYLDIYHLANQKASKKEVNIWQKLVDYLDEDDFELIGYLSTLRKFENNDYAVLTIYSEKNYRYFLLNLKTLKIDGEKTSKELEENGRIALELDSTKAFSAGVNQLGNSFWKADTYKGNINLKNNNRSAFNLFSKKDSFAYKVIKSENGMITNGRELLDLESEFIPVGKSVYEDLYIPSKWSINGKNQKIVSYDEIQEYYNGEIEKRSLVS
ncbi:hypothetical protein HMPREF0833_11768 [Streptococcus parasanguinis ATCC 15912]|jgi:probable lipoprotein|uniref:Lipoprotein n=2 Tax=Streptococcus parasanguinis TaxID=1318 RepID=F8DHG8_STREP|nr:hypothetical protein HMPREF0833_11768 [Streptococcus parasanguinis ATCC 15912]